jgi:hypothetical protein
MSFPSSLHTIFTLVDNVDDVLATHPNTLSAEIRYLEDKVGVDNSAVDTSLDYGLKHASGFFRTHTHDGSSDDGSSTLSPTTINAFTLGGKLTAGVNEIEGSNFDINGGTIDGITDLGIADGGTGASTAQAALNALAGATTANRVLRGNGSNIVLAQVDLTTDVTGALPAANGGTGVTGAVNTANGVVILDASGYVPNNSVDTSALKTSTGEVSTSTTGGVDLTLPGGEYGLYPQVKGSGSGWINMGWGNGSDRAFGASYTTNVCIMVAGGSTGYAKQRYITASGEDFWILLQTDKETQKIVNIYAAPDHPSYGNGGDFSKLPNTFDYIKYNIILVDKDTTKNLIKESKDKNISIATLINESYNIDFNKEEVYEPLHSGKYIIKKNTGEIVDSIPLNNLDDYKQEKVLVSTIPEYIKVRKLIKK